MEGEILNAFKYVKNISTKQATFARSYSIMKKTHKNLTENELENVVDNLVVKTIKIFNQRNKSYSVPDFTDDTVLAGQDNENLIEEEQLQDKRYEISDKDNWNLWYRNEIQIIWRILSICGKKDVQTKGRYSSRL